MIVEMPVEADGWCTHVCTWALSSLGKLAGKTKPAVRSAAAPVANHESRTGNSCQDACNAKGTSVWGNTEMAKLPETCQ